MYTWCRVQPVSYSKVEVNKLSLSRWINYGHWRQFHIVGWISSPWINLKLQCWGFLKKNVAGWYHSFKFLKCKLHGYVYIYLKHKIKMRTVNINLWVRITSGEIRRKEVLQDRRKQDVSYVCNIYFFFYMRQI